MIRGRIIWFLIGVIVGIAAHAYWNSQIPLV